jgi:4-hydroxybenzoate polyprenyltransferase
VRISNAPTAVTGSLVGSMVGAHTAAGLPDTRALALCAVGSVLLYAGGMVMNDYFDQPLDRLERPGRPIVSGQVPEAGALTLGMLLLAGGVAAMVACAGAVVPWALLLLSTILAYNLLHRDRIAAPVLMASCRMLVPVIAAIASAPSNRPEWPLLASVALPLGAFTAAISMAARHEADDAAVAPSMPFALALAAMIAPNACMMLGTLEPFPRDSIMLAAPSLIVAGWIALRGRAHMRRPGDAPRGVMRWIAAIAFVDAASLAPLGGGALILIAAGAGALTVLMQRRILGS